MESKQGTCVLYATDEGASAYDGRENENSYFTEALLKGFKQPYMRFYELFEFVKEQVKTESSKYQKDIQEPVVCGMEPVRNFIFNNKLPKIDVKK